MYYVYCDISLTLSAPRAIMRSATSSLRRLKGWNANSAAAGSVPSTPANKCAKSYFGLVSDQSRFVFYYIIIEFVHLRWIRNGIDIQNPFVKCQLHTLFQFSHVMENVDKSVFEA